LVNQLLDLSRIQSGRLVLEAKLTNLAALVGEICANARRDIRVRTPTELMAEVDPLRFEQLLTNLIDNAIKFSDETTEIAVTLEHPPSSAITLLVTDHGIGIPPDERELVFERFHQVRSHPIRGGMGLGLYISRQIAELHGGTLTAEFPEPGGTQMRVTLPGPNVGFG
jgi:signal transduction histidine kinase